MQVWTASICSTTSTPSISRSRGCGASSSSGIGFSLLNIRYDPDHTDRVRSSTLMMGVQVCVSLPVFMEETSSRAGSVLALDITDKVEVERGEGFLERCILSLGFENLGDEGAADVS